MKNIKESICIKNELMFLAAKPGTLALFTSSFLFFVIEEHVSRLSGKSDVPPPVLEIKEIFCYDNYGYRVQAGSDDMIKVIASDMDGTLLNSEHTISKRTYDIIQKVQRAGIRFMIATGRDFPSASDTLK